MTAPLRVAVASLARPTFDVALAQSIAEQLVAALSAREVEVAGTGAALILDAEAAGRAAAALENQEIDLLVLLQATFADSSMALMLARAANEHNRPILLWATPDARDGGRLRLNSLCGVNLAAHALMLADIRYDYVLAAPDDSGALAHVMKLARAATARRRLDGATIGVVGEHPAGFDTCRFDDADLKAIFGVDVQKIPLHEALEAARNAAEGERAAVVERVRRMAPNVDTLDVAAVRGTAGVHVALADVVRNEGLRGVAVRCWPEFFTELGCAACGAMSLLCEDGCPASCEADVNGTVTSLLLQELSGGAAFIADLVSIDSADNTGVLWHCGLAPASMADPESGIEATIHSNRRLPLLFEFALRPGRVTLARLHRRSLAGGRDGYSLVVGGGEIVRAPRSYGGTSGVIRFDKPAGEVLGAIMRLGMEHHLCLTYGDVRDELRAFARLVELPIVELA